MACLPRENEKIETKIDTTDGLILTNSFDSQYVFENLPFIRPPARAHTILFLFAAQLGEATGALALARVRKRESNAKNGEGGKDLLQSAGIAIKDPQV